MLDLFKYPYEAIDPMSPPYADVRVTTASSRIASKSLKSTGESAPRVEVRRGGMRRRRSEQES